MADLKKLMGEYNLAKGLERALDGSPWNLNVRRNLGLIKHSDPDFYSEKGPDAVEFAAQEYVGEAEEALKENIKYEDLIAQYDNKKLKELLSQLPVLTATDSALRNLSAKHKAFYEAFEEFNEGVKMQRKDPEGYKRMVISSVSSEADRYLAAGRDESTRRVAYGQVLEAQRKLYAEIDKIKPAPQRQP